jgi:hypothetical protein
VHLEDRAGLPDGDKTVLERELAGLVTLHDLIHWGLARGLMVSAVVVQDEFTHDVVMPAGAGRVLVFDCT